MQDVEIGELIAALDLPASSRIDQRVPTLSPLHGLDPPISAEPLPPVLNHTDHGLPASVDVHVLGKSPASAPAPPRPAALVDKLGAPPIPQPMVRYQFGRHLLAARGQPPSFRGRKASAAGMVCSSLR
jgi:hypothetical protein